MDQAGEYYCRASSENGSIKSKPATLSVIGKLFIKLTINIYYLVMTSLLTLELFSI